MGFSSKLKEYIELCLTVNYGNPVNLQAVNPVSGGDINAAYCIITNAGKFMVKLNSKSAYPGMFKRESEGLTAIRNTRTIAVLEVVLQFDFEDDSCMLMEWVDASRATPAASEQLGYQLAAMHRNTAPFFGFDTDNYMGSLPQSNHKHDAWAQFFVQERLEPMMKIAIDKRLLSYEDARLFDKLYDRLPKLFNEEAPALIHGDLWGGNYLIRNDGKPYLIDPAISYGHREFDIAMTTLFSGFSNEFYTAYHEAFPLAKGWQERVDLWNLYPLLLHLNLFGMSYLGQVRYGLNKYL
ncbi:fructosamine kinase family protein [Mucilaginibacter terrae]|uniref:Protein-ribulosamine 3-kinase n=1 Tax=Mucilaginibacter terrae TaxID=1955052 RepID=A0ABU3GP58_9SPHI|nr:fructosamine kinase family protein [Mucilaginibacter terrae]MDT3401563.1 protein-ribulosamine 3-kinase [Mucilaginibacter terrae]